MARFMLYNNRESGDTAICEGSSNQTMEQVYLMGAVRTAIGKYGGSLKNVPAHELGALVIREALERARVPGEWVDEVILGEVRQSTEASNIARCALLEAGLPETVPGFTVNRLCASAMQAILCGCQEIWTGQAQTIVAGGTENMSRAPIYLRGTRWGGNKNTLVDSNIEAGSTAAPASIYGTELSMTRTAENVAERFHITREEQDAFSVESQRRAAAAIQAGGFAQFPGNLRGKEGTHYNHVVYAHGPGQQYRPNGVEHAQVAHHQIGGDQSAAKVHGDHAQHHQHIEHGLRQNLHRASGHGEDLLISFYDII